MHSALFSHFTLSCCTFFVLHSFYVALFSCFMLPLFHVALFCIVIFSCCNFLLCTISAFYLFHVARSSYCIVFILYFFSCDTLFMYCTISCCTFTRFNVFYLRLHFFPVTLCSCCTVSGVIARTSSNIYNGSFAIVINNAIKYCCEVVHLRYSLGSCLRFYYFTFSLSYSFHVTLF